MSDEIYNKALRDPRWQKKSCEIKSRDNWTCQKCGDTTTTLETHHRVYPKDRSQPWLVDDDSWLITLCVPCHQKEGRSHDMMAAIIPLNFSIKTKFWFASIQKLSLGFQNCKVNNSNESEVASAIQFALLNNEVMNQLIQIYRNTQSKGFDNVRFIQQESLFSTINSG